MAQDKDLENDHGSERKKEDIDVNRAVEIVETFLSEYRDPQRWNPRETRVLPSGDYPKNIKIWFNFGPGVTEDELEELKNEPLGALRKEHPELEGFTLEIRVDSID